MSILLLKFSKPLANSIDNYILAIILDSMRIYSAILFTLFFTSVEAIPHERQHIT